jgi:hypothetical protein
MVKNSTHPQIKKKRYLLTCPPDSKIWQYINGKRVSILLKEGLMTMIEHVLVYEAGAFRNVMCGTFIFDVGIPDDAKVRFMCPDKIYLYTDKMILSNKRLIADDENIQINIILNSTYEPHYQSFSSSRKLEILLWTKFKNVKKDKKYDDDIMKNCNLYAGNYERVIASEIKNHQQHKFRIFNAMCTRYRNKQTSTEHILYIVSKHRDVINTGLFCGFLLHHKDYRKRMLKSLKEELKRFDGLAEFVSKRMIYMLPHSYKMQLEKLGVRAKWEHKNWNTMSIPQLHGRIKEIYPALAKINFAGCIDSLP